MEACSAEDAAESAARDGCVRCGRTEDCSTSTGTERRVVAGAGIAEIAAVVIAGSSALEWATGLGRSLAKVTEGLRVKIGADKSQGGDASLCASDRQMRRLMG
jgi:hypothetical protein